MKIHIIGTRGIPNYHGGYEQFAEFFSEYAVESGHDVTVYNSSDHPYQEDEWNGVKIVHKNDPESKLGTVGQFFYDLNCILQTRKDKPDIILQLGYTSSTIWHWLLPKKNSKIITNMDGLEWKRSKYSYPVRQFLKLAEYLAIKGSHYFIADSLGIQSYLSNKYKVDSTYIAYGADVFDTPDIKVLEQYNLKPEGYNMLIARMEPENNIEMILDGAVQANDNVPFLVIGNYDKTDFGKKMKKKYENNSNIVFLGAVYNIDILNSLRYYSKLYFHGHSVGGTNPSLLEAMASDSLIAAHDNPFNRGNLAENGFYFQNSDDVKNIIGKVDNKNDFQNYIDNNKQSIKEKYSWKYINDQTLELFENALKKSEN